MSFDPISDLELRWVMTSADLDAAGLTRRRAASFLTEHGYVRFQRGVHYRRDTANRWEQHLSLVLLVAGPNGAAERQTAAAIWQLDGFERGRAPIQVQVPRTERRRDRRIRRSLRQEPASQVDGLPLTAVAETLVEGGRGLQARWATARHVQLLRPDELVGWTWLWVGP